MEPTPAPEPPPPGPNPDAILAELAQKMLEQEERFRDRFATPCDVRGCGNLTGYVVLYRGEVDFCKVHMGELIAALCQVPHEARAFMVRAWMKLRVGEHLGRA